MEKARRREAKSRQLSRQNRERRGERSRPSRARNPEKKSDLCLRGPKSSNRVKSEPEKGHNETCFDSF